MGLYWRWVRQTFIYVYIDNHINRVFKYRYVHRLIQNVVDGKLVELPSNTDSTNEHTASQVILHIGHGTK